MVLVDASVVTSNFRYPLSWVMASSSMSLLHDAARSDRQRTDNIEYIFFIIVYA